MAHYSRGFRKYNSYNYSEPSKMSVSIIWDQLTNATYNVKFNFRGNEQWKVVEAIIKTIKQGIPSSQREYIEESKTWVIGESQIKFVKDLCDAIPNMDVNFVEKPAEQTYTAKFHSKESDFEEFKRMLSFAHVDADGLQLSDVVTATKLFRKAAMYLHPDRNPQMAGEMSALNEVYTRLFKTQPTSQLQETTT